MFAAARFADLPELRELRSLFAEKYGTSLETFANEEVNTINQPAASFFFSPLSAVSFSRWCETDRVVSLSQFVRRLKAGPPSKDVKLQLMRDIALEHTVQWDSKALEPRLFTPPPATVEVTNLFLPYWNFYTTFSAVQNKLLYNVRFTF